MRTSLVALNLIGNNNILLNPSNYPMLLYWNESNGRSIPEELFFNEQASKYIIEKCGNINLYTLSKISFFYFIDRDNDGDEDYTEQTIDIQNLYALKVLTNEQNFFYKDYVNKTFEYLYYCSYKEEYNITNNPLEWEEDIIHVYKKIQEKYPKKISKPTVINYVRSELTQKYNLNTDNSIWIIEKLENILSDET